MQQYRFRLFGQDNVAHPPTRARYWKYRAIYRLNNQQVGQWSAVTSISVMG